MKSQTIKNFALCSAVAWMSFACLLFGQESFAFASNAVSAQVLVPETSTVASRGRDPLELLYFDVIWDRHEVIITWDAVHEMELVGFQIERAEDGREFKRVGWVYSRELSKEVFYEFVDHSVTPGGGTYFYRLKMVDFDGTITYSPTTMALRFYQ